MYKLIFQMFTRPFLDTLRMRCPILVNVRSNFTNSQNLLKEQPVCSMRA